MLFHIHQNIYYLLRQYKTMTTISVKVTPRDEAKIERLLDDGNYSTKSEILRAGLRKIRV